ncbi:MAG: hypothetical protein RLZZ587_224 [Actinomycetota bacterium]
MERTRRADKTFQFPFEARKYAAAVRQIGEVILERRKTGNHLSVDREGGHAVGNLLLGIRKNRENSATNLFERLSLGIGKCRDVRVYVCCAQRTTSGSGPVTRLTDAL